jgi:hypothetical protein
MVVREKRLLQFGHEAGRSGSSRNVRLRAYEQKGCSGGWNLRIGMTICKALDGFTFIRNYLESL